MLVDFMQQNEGIAKGLLNAPEYRAKSGELWDELTSKLNCIGPPTKTRDGWKKVWKDYKYHIKSKVRQNNKLIGGTGGGPCKQYVFSPVEEDVIRLLDLRTQESGLKVRKFGARNIAPNSLVDINDNRSFSPETTALIVESEEILLSCSTDKIQHQDVEEYHLRFEEEECSGRKKTPSPKPARRTQTTPATSRKLLQVQVDQQKEFHDRSISLLEEQNRLIGKQNKILAEETKKIRRLKEEELRILKRRAEWEEKENYENRKMRVAELELKRRKLELKEQELGNQRD